MTTGSISRTSPDGSSVFSKVWTGIDGKTAENPYSLDLMTVQKQKCQYWSVAWSGDKELSRTRVPSADYCYYDSSLPLLPLDGNQELECLAKLAEQIRGHDFNLAVFGAESKQSIDLVVGTATALIRSFDSARKGDFRDLIRRMRRKPTGSKLDLVSNKIKLGDFTGALLALRYGWQPLLRDLYELVKAMRDRTAKRQVTFRAQKTVTRSSELGAFPDKYPMSGQQSCSLKYKVVLTEKLSVAREFGLLDPATVLWEKKPWSFVFDWFIPIGTWLSNLSFFGSFGALALRTVFQQTECALVNMGVWKNNTHPGDDWLANMSFTGKRVVLVRTVGPIDVPLPNFKTLAKVFSTTHMQNGAALIQQQLASAAKGGKLPIPRILR